MADNTTDPSLSMSRSERRRRTSLHESFTRETQHVLTLNLLRSMLPDGWDCPPGNEHGIQSDGLYLQSSPPGDNGGDNDGLRIIRANRSIRISTLIPIVNSTRQDCQLDLNNSIHSSSLVPPSLSRASSLGTTRSADFDYVYYFEVFPLHGVFTLGFEADNGEIASENSVQTNSGPGMVPGSIGLHVNGDLWIDGARVPNWTHPFQNGDTIGCGVSVGNNAKYFFTRNGDIIDSGTANCLVSSTQTALTPCVGLPCSSDTVVRTNFGLNPEHPFLWKGTERIRILSHVTPTSSNLLDDSLRLDEAFLQPDLIRGHTVGVTGDVPPSMAVGQGEHSGDDIGLSQHSMRRHSDMAPDVWHRSLTDDDLLLLTQGLDSETDLNAENDEHASQEDANTTGVSQNKDMEMNGSDGMDALDLNDIKELARELRNATSASHAHNGALSQLVDVCRSNLKRLNSTVQRATMGVETEHDLGELLEVNGLVNDAIQAAEEKKTESIDRSSHTDIFSLLCHLRGQKRKRHAAVWGLLQLTNRGYGERCGEIITSGGMQSLLTLFKTSRDSTELMMVSALTVVYLLPSLLDSNVQSSSYIYMGVIECLQFLIQSSTESIDIDISPSEIRTASALAMANLWLQVLVPKLRSTDMILATNGIQRFGSGERKQDPFSGRRIRRRSSLSSQTGEEVDSSILINAFTSLSIMAATSEALMQDNERMENASDIAFIVESICDVEFAKPMAMKEGVMNLLLQWLQSGDNELERPAANALRNLALAQDDYVAGWVHCQLLNENALVYIVRKLESDDSRVRLSIAELISSLTVAPHTRTGIIEARGVKYLVQLLGSVDIQSQDEGLAIAAGNALLRLIMGEACSGGASASFLSKAQSYSKKECIVDDIIENGALNSLVSMARAETYGDLRNLSAKILRVISEGCSGHSGRDGKERDLCDAEAVSALGKILWNDISFIRSSVENSLASSDTSDLINDSLSNEFLTSTNAGSTENTLSEVRHVLRGLVNILHSSSSPEDRHKSTAVLETQMRACSQLITSGGVKSLLWIASMTPNVCSKLEITFKEPRFCHDIQIDTCQTLASLCPLLLLSRGQTSDTAKWAPKVLSALVKFLKSQILSGITNGNFLGLTPCVLVEVLQGLGCLVDWKPLKTIIVDEFMPHLLELHRYEDRNVSEAAARVCLALGFTEIESGENDAYLLGDKFNLARSRLIQAMARDEIRSMLQQIWLPALKATSEKTCGKEATEHISDMSNDLGPLFPLLCQDFDTAEKREKMRQQFMNVYDCHSVPSSPRVQSSASLGLRMKRTMHRSGSYVEGEELDILSQAPRSNSDGMPSNLMQEINLNALSEFARKDSGDTSTIENFLQCHQYPLNGTMEERKWVIEHCQSLMEGALSNAPSLPCLPARVNDLLDVCFPSVLIRDQIIPLCGFKPNASFNFRALTMPSGRYFSFRREGQLIYQECDNSHNSEQVHYTLCFQNSSFAGEFTESLLQALYLCPIIKGLSFSNDKSDDESAYDASCHAHEGSELLPFLAKAIPSSVTYLTFDNVLSNNAALALSHILKSTNEEDGDEETVCSVKGSLHALAIINSPHIHQSIFSSLVESLNGFSSPLQFLHTLDLSGNLLGDAGSAKVLSIALSPSSSTSIENLDLSRNGIGEGTAVKRVLEECVSNDPTLQVLNLSYNDFGEGEIAHQLAASLGDVFSQLFSLNLSGNYLSGTFLAALGGVLPLSCNLVDLNISNNQFSSSSINSFFSRLHSMSKSDESTPLCFVHLEGNAPLLAPNQEMVLSEILSANRQRRVATYLKRQSDAIPLETDSDTNALSSISDITGEPKTDRKLPPAETMTVLFSAPLVWRDGGNEYHPIEMLDFKREKSLLWQCFSEASRNIDLSYDNATTDRFQAVMTRGCKCLHFSGHGHPECLTFEDGSGGIHWFHVDQLKALVSGGVEDGEPPFEFVFVSACHSGLAGHTFVDCGVPHVVCCQQESQLMDRAALSFTRAFYLALAFGRTVKDSFEIGKHAVLSSATVVNPGEETEKFMLLPEDGNHDVPVFSAEEVPEWPLPHQSGSRDANDSLPAPPQGFIGRETDMYHVLNLVLNRRFVNIVGSPGMGRSSLAAALCHYIDERKSTLLFDDIYFVQSLMKRPVAGKSSPIISLHSQLVSTDKAATMPEDADLDEIIQEILTSLKQTKSLLVFDEIEALDGTTEAQDFQFFLGQIFKQTKDVHVLVTSDKSNGLSPLASVGEKVYNLGPLNFRNTIKLFAYHCPHLHSSRERKELVEQFASHTSMSRLTENSEATERVKSMLGGGIPAKTFAVAYEMTAEEFQDLQTLRSDQ